MFNQKKSNWINKVLKKNGDIFNPNNTCMLADKSIMEYNRKGLLIEQPIRKEQIQPNSVDLTLGNTYKIIKPNSKLFCMEIVDPRLPMEYESGTFEVGRTYDFRHDGYFIEISEEELEEELNIENIEKEGERFLLYPNQFILMATNEILNIPNGIVGFVCGRSSVARLGIAIEEAGLIDAGFRGTITLEIVNQYKYPILLYPGMRIAQVYFFKAEKALNMYGESKGSKYNNQIEAMQSKLYMDKEFNK